MTTPPITAVSAVLLVDQRIQNYETIVSAVKDDVRCIVFEPNQVAETCRQQSITSFQFILNKITELGVSSFANIGIVQHNSKESYHQFFGLNPTELSTVFSVESTDPTLQTWAGFAGFITTLKTTYGIQKADLMACALYSNPNWKYIIDTLATQTAVEIRASTDDTGAAALGGNWFLESHTGVNLKGIYFTDAIDAFSGLLDMMFGVASSTQFGWNNMITPPSTLAVWGNNLTSTVLSTTLSAKLINITKVFSYALNNSTPNNGYIFALDTSGILYGFGNKTFGSSPTTNIINVQSNSGFIDYFTFGALIGLIKSNGTVSFITDANTTEAYIYYTTFTVSNAIAAYNISLVNANPNRRFGILTSNSTFMTYRGPNNAGTIYPESGSAEYTITNVAKFSMPGSRIYVLIKRDRTTADFYNELGWTNIGNIYASVGSYFGASIFGLDMSNNLLYNGIVNGYNYDGLGMVNAPSAARTNVVTVKLSHDGNTGYGMILQLNGKVTFWTKYISEIQQNDQAVNMYFSKGDSNAGSIIQASLKYDGTLYIRGSYGSNTYSSQPVVDVVSGFRFIAFLLNNGNVILHTSTNTFVTVVSTNNAVGLYLFGENEVNVVLNDGSLVRYYNGSITYNTSVVTYNGSTSQSNTILNSNVAGVVSTVGLQSAAIITSSSLDSFTNFDKFQYFLSRNNRRINNFNSLNGTYTISDYRSVTLINPFLDSTKSYKLLIPDYQSNTNLSSSPYNIKSNVTIGASIENFITAIDEGEQFTINGDTSVTYVLHTPFVYTVTTSPTFALAKVSSITTAYNTFTIYGDGGFAGTGNPVPSPPSLSNFTISTKTFGGANFDLSAPTTDNNVSPTFTYSVPAGNGVATISGSTVTIVSVGSVTVTATQTASNGYLSGTITATLTVNAATPTYTPASPSASVTKTFGVDISFSLTSLVAGISNSSGAYTFSSGSGAVSISDGVATIVAYTPSAITITASQDASGNYASGSTAISVLINRGTPTYQSVAQISKTYGTDISFSLAAVMSGISNSNGAYTFSSASNAISFSGSVVTILGYSASTISILASQDASGNYNASSTTISLVVAAATPTFQSVAQITKTFSTDVSFSMTSIVAGMSNSDGAYIFTRSGAAVDAISISGDVVTILAYTPSAVNIDVYQEASGNYTYKSGTISLLVARKVPTYGAFTIPAVTYSPDGSFSIVQYAPTTDSTGVALTYTITSLVSSSTRSISANWTSISVSSTGQYRSAVVEGGYIWTSSDYGATWTSRTAPGTPSWVYISLSSTGQYQSAMATNGYIWTSSDYGVTWTSRTTVGSRNWYSISISSTGQYQSAVVNGGYIWTSSDYGVSWGSRTAPGSLNWISISLSSTGQYQSASIYGSGYIWTSSDYGVTWTSRTGPGSLSWRSIAVSSTGQYQSAVVANGGNIWNSSDYGITWTVRSSPGTPNWVCISLSSTGQYQTAVAYGGYIWTSNDYGISWTSRPEPGSLSCFSISLSSTGQYQSVAVKGGYIWTSNDYGVTWSQYASYYVVGSTSNVANISSDGTLVTIVGHGSATITASQVANGNYAAGSATSVFVVNRAAPTFLKAFTITDKTFGDAPFSLLPFTDGLDNTDGTYHFSSSDSSIVSISTVDNVTATILAYTPSPITITVDIDACGNYAAATTSGTLTVARVAPTYQSVPQVAKTYGVDVSFSLTAVMAGISNSSGAYTFTSSSAAVTVSGSVATIQAYTPSAITITATQAASSNYAASSKTFTVLVSRGAPTYQTVSQVAKTYGVDVSFSLADVMSGISNSDGAYTFSGGSGVISISSDVATILAYTPSAVTLTATQDASGNYAASSKTFTLLVSRGPPTYQSVTQVAKTFGVDVSFSMTALVAGISNSSGAYTFSSESGAVSISGAIVTILAYTPSAITITATQAADGNYAASSANVSLLVSIGTPTLSNFDNVNKLYGISPFVLTPPTSNSSGAFTYTSSNTSVATITNATVTIIGSGTSTITATQDASGNYQSGTISSTLTVTNPTPTYQTVSQIAKTYGTDVSFSLTDIMVGVSNSSGAYTFSSDSGAISISGAVVTILAYTPSEVSITASQAAAGDYNAGSATLSLLVSRATPTYQSVAQITKTYGVDVSFSLASVVAGISNSDGAYSLFSSASGAVSFSGDVVTILAYTSSAITITASQDASGNYAASSKAISLLVNRGPPTYQSVSQIAKTYGTDVSFSMTDVMVGVSNSSGAYTFSSAASEISVSGDVVTILAYTPSAITITATQAAAGNYTSSSATVTLLVDRKVPSYGAFTLSAVTYEDAPYSLVSNAPTSESNATYSYTSSNSAVATVNTDGTVVTVIGQGYTTITASQDISGNYAAGSTTASLLVNRAAPTFLKAFTIDNKTFGDAPFSLLPFTVDLDNTDGTYHFSSSDTSVVTISEVDGVTATILAYTASTPVTIYVAIDACGNYAASTTSGTLTINRKVPAYQSVSTVAKTFGDAAFSLVDYMSGISESSGSYTFASSDVSSVRIESDGVTATILAYKSSAITITATQAASGNYAAGAKTFSMTVARVAPTIGALALGALNGYYDVSDGFFTLTAPTSNSSGGFTYSSDNSAVALVSSPSFSTANLIARYDPSDSSNYTIENGYISYLSDLTGNYSQRLRQNGNGTNVVTVGSKQMLNCSSADTGFYSNLPLPFYNTFFMVIRYNPNSIVSAPNLGGFAQHGNRDTDWSILKKPDTENTIILKSNNDNSTGLTLSPNTSYILVSRLGGANGNSREFWAYSENGTSSYATNDGITIVPGTKYMYIGNSSSNNSCRSHIGEMMYYDESISNSDLSNNLSYLQAKWFNASSSTKVVRLIGSGNANISATQDICGNYNTGSVSSLLRVGATVPTFGTFTVSSVTKTYGDGPFTLTPPTSNSNGAFTFTSSNSAILSISGTTATIIAGGTVNVTVLQDPSGSFTRKSITTAFTVQPKNPNLRNFSDIVLSYILEGGFTVTSPETDGSGYFTYSSSNIAVVSNGGTGNPGFGITGGGTATITASQIGSQNYAASSITATVTINPVTPSASYSNFTRAFDVGTFTIPPPTTASNGAVSYVSSDTSVATISGSTVTIKKVGETTITATIAATASYFTRDVSAVFTVTRGTPTIVGLYTQFLTMTQDPYTLSPTSTSTGTFTYVSDNSAIVFITNGGTTFNVASVGTATITATISQDPSGNYNSRNYGFTFTVVRATSNLSSATFTVPVLMTYGDTPVNIITAPTSDSSGAITYTSNNVNIATIHPTTGLITAVGAGWNYFVASQAQTNVHNLNTVQSNYMQFVSKSVTQTRVAPYTSSTITKYYGDASFQLSTVSESTASKLFTTNVAGVVNISTSSNIGYIEIVNVGTVVITGQQFANSQYSTQNNLTWTLTVEKGTTALTELAATLSKNVTDAPFTLAVSSASAGVKSYALSNPDSSNVLVVNSSTGVVTLKGAGTATIVASQAASSLYNAPSSVSCVVTVAAAGTSLQGSTITSARTFDNVDMTGASLSGTTVTGVSFAGATMTNAVLTGATVRNATLTSTNMVDSTLTNADVSGTSFAGATMTRVTMTGATLTNSTLTSADLSGASMANTTITGTTFTSSTMTNAVLTGATLTNSTLTSAVLTGASLVSANVTGSTFVGASLAGADLSGATVTNANFTNANISGADITNVAFSSLQKIQLLKNMNNRAIGGIQVGDISGSVVLAAISGTSPAVSIPNIASAAIKVVIPTTSTVASDTLPNVVLDTTTSDKFYFPINEGEYFQILGVKYYTDGGIVRNYVTNDVVEVISYGNRSIWLIAGSIIASVLAVNTISASTFTVPSGKLDTDASFNITVAPTSNSDAPIVYSSNHTSVATIHPSTGLITIVSQGYVSFTATQAATLLYEAGSKTSNELHVDKLINFTLSGLNQTILMSTSGLLDASSVSLETTDATAVFYVKLSDMTDIFKYQTDSFDMTENDASDVKYYVFNRSWPAALKINPVHAMMNKTESDGMLGTTDIFTENKMLAKHDFLRYLSLKLFNTIHGVDLFNNESDLLENATYWGEDVRTNIRNILTGISTTSSDGTMSYDASGNKYLTNATTSNTNLCRELVRQLLAGASSRFGSINDVNLPQGIPLIENDTINFKITFNSAPSQNLLTGVTEIPSRSYMVKLVMKTSITGLNTPVVDSEMYPNAYPYSSSVVSYAPTESSSAVYNIYSSPAPMPFAKFGFDGWYYTNSTAWVTSAARDHVKWLLPANSGSSTVGSLLYIRVNLKIHNKVALPYIMVYTTSNSSRKYPVSNTGALANGGVYSFYMNFNSYTVQPAMIGYTNAALANTTGSGSFATNEGILNIALETDSGAAAGTVDFTLSSIIVGDASGEKEYGFEAAVPTAYP